MKKSLLVVAVASAVTVVIIHQQMKISDLEKALAEKPATENIVERVPAVAPAAAPRREAAVEAPRTEPVPMPVAAAQPAPAAPPATAAKKAAPNMGDFMKNIGSMMTNPAMKEMVRAQSKMQLDMRFDRLFKFLNKSPEQTAALKDLLMERQMAMMDGGMSFMNGDVSPDDRKKKAAELKTMNDGYDKKIADLLGTDDYDAFKQYENTEPERMQVDMFKSSAASSGEPLTDQQEYDLVNAMYQARTNAPPSVLNQAKDTPPDPAQFTGANMDAMLQQMEKTQSQYTASASAILTPTQFAQFQKFADQQKAMNEMGLKFAAQMFGGGSNAVSAPPAVAPVIQVHVQTP